MMMQFLSMFKDYTISMDYAEKFEYALTQDS